MKILMSLMGLDIGGAETHVVELSKELKRRDHDLVIVSGGGVYVPEIEAAGIRHYEVKMASKNPMAMRKAVGELKKVLLKERPDIVHAHARIPAFLMGIARKCLGKRFEFVYVTSVHGAFSTAFPLKYLTNWGDMSLAVSDDLKKYLMDNYKIPSGNIHVSINGIDMKKFAPETECSDVVKELGLDPDAKRVVCVTRLDPRVCSHAGWLMDIMPELDKAVPGIEYVLVGGGDAFDALSEKAESVNKSLGRRAVILTGGRTDVNKILASADVCVGVSRAILEPMAMKKKCVIVGEWGYIGILSEENLETARGCNFTCRDCGEVSNSRLADDIIKLIGMDKTDGDRVADFGRSVVDRYYSAAKMADDNEAFYRDAMRRFGKHMTILGYYGFRNCGDDALLGAVVNDIEKLDPNIGINVLSHSPEETAERFGVASAARFGMTEVIKALKRSKLFILGGGSLVQDATSTKSLWYYLWCVRLAKLFKVPVMLYANGIGPVTKKANRKMARKVLDKVDHITLRDNDSLEALTSLGVKKPPIEVTADPAFGLECSPENDAKLLLERFGVMGKYVCLSVRTLVRSGKDDGSFTESFAEFADHISEKYSCTPVFVAMQYKKDVPLCKEVIAGMRTRGICIDEELSPSDVLGLLSGSEAVVAVRLHMLIFGALLGKPVFGINYDPKVAGFSEVIGSPYCISPEEFSKGNYKESFESFMNEREKLSENLLRLLPELKRKAFKNAEIAVDIFKGNRK